ncbi:MAG: dihydrofolate reductase [Bacteroidales bacterium]|nr:dihydrofolate reductase [Bacteroidales bacterium]
MEIPVSQDKIYMIVAIANNWVIGKDGNMPWHMPADLKFFKRTTMGHAMVMGRRTFESFGSRPLPGRTSVVVTHNPNWQTEGVIVAHSLEKALDKVKEHEKIFIIGGSDLYRQGMEIAGTLIVTRIFADLEGDTFFPEIAYEKWKEVEREDHQPDEKNPYRYAFITYRRRGR